MCECEPRELSDCAAVVLLLDLLDMSGRRPNCAFACLSKSSQLCQSASRSHTWALRFREVASFALLQSAGWTAAAGGRGKSACTGGIEAAGAGADEEDLAKHILICFMRTNEKSICCC